MSDAQREKLIGVGAVVARLRNEKGLSQARLAQLAKLSAAFLSDLENGRRDGAEAATLLRIAEALDVHPRLLIEPAMMVRTADLREALMRYEVAHNRARRRGAA